MKMTEEDNRTLVDVENISKIYNPGENEVRALDHVTLKIAEGGICRDHRPVRIR